MSSIPTLTVGGVNQLPFVEYGSMSAKYNTVDFTLVNPTTIPTLGLNVTMTNPTWTGSVTSITKTDTTEKVGATKYLRVKITATNDTDASASAAPFNLSDTPNNTTTFGYSNLSIQLANNKDGSTETHGSCVIYKEGLWPAMTFTLTSTNQGYSATAFTARDVTVTWFKKDYAVYHVEFGDPIVTMSVWLNESAADFILPIDETKITDGAVTTPKIAANSVTSTAIASQSITADKLAAELILASLLATSDSGKRVELDTNGIRLYDTDETVLVNVPTTLTDPVSVKGKIEASQLVSTSTAEFRGTNTLAKGSTTTLQVGVANPGVAPTVVSALDSLTLTTAPAHVGHGLAYDSAGGAGGATATYWVGADAGTSSDIAYEYNATTGALLRTITKTGSTTTTTKTTGSTSHVSDTAQAYSGTTNSQIASVLTMPEAGTITKVAAYFAGFGGDATARVCLWDSSGNLLRASASFTASSRSFVNGNSILYNKALTSTYNASSGQTIWAGFVHTSSSDGFQYDRDDGASKTTKRGSNLYGDMTSIATDTATKPNVYITYNVTVDTSLEGTIGKIIGVARQGTAIWVLDTNGKLFKYNQADLSYLGQFDLSANISGTKANAGLFFDGTNLVITTATGVTGTDQVKFVKVTTAGAFSTSVSATGLSINGSTATIRGGYYDATRYWVSINGTVYAFTASTGANVVNRDFGTTTETTSGVVWDGTQFRGWSSASNPTKIWKYTSWDWTTESPVYWIGYSWYDSNATGGTHETALSPLASLTLGRRRKINVSNPVIPTGGTDDPDKVRIYFNRNATQPSAGSYKLQATDALTARTFTTFATGGAADTTSNTFPSGTSATLQSNSASQGFTLKATGAINRTGTTFPTTVATNDLFYRSDLGLEFFYDGTRWLSVEEFAISLYADADVQSLSATLNHLVAPAPVVIGSDIYLTRLTCQFLVNGGTALSGSHSWISTNRKRDSANTDTSFGSAITINSGSSSVWRTSTQNINALLNAGTTYYAFAMLWTKTGTPGNLFNFPVLYYRHVAT